MSFWDKLTNFARNITPTITKGNMYGALAGVAIGVAIAIATGGGAIAALILGLGVGATGGIAGGAIAGEQQAIANEHTYQQPQAAPAQVASPAAHSPAPAASIDQPAVDGKDAHNGPENRFAELVSTQRLGSVISR